MNRGGAEKVISTILPKLDLKYKVTLILFYDSIEFSIPETIEVVILSSKKNLNFFEKILFFPTAILKYNKLLKTEKVDISLSFLTRPNFINSIIKIFNKSVKIIISERCYPSIAYKSHKLRWYLYKILIPFLYNKADFLFSNSIHINEDLRKNFNIRIPMVVIYNPIDIPATDIIMEKNIEEFKVVNVGSFTTVKNQKIIVDAIKKLNFKVRLTLLGDGPNKDGLISYARKLDLNNLVDFKGQVRNVNDYLYRNNCFVLSSNTEGFPNALLEAIAVGLPVISTNCISGPLEILNENNAVTIKNGEFYIAKYGILINVNDEIGLAEAIGYLKNHPNARNILSVKAKKRAYDFTVDIFIEKLEVILGV